MEQLHFILTKTNQCSVCKFSQCTYFDNTEHAVLLHKYIIEWNMIRHHCLHGNLNLNLIQSVWQLVVIVQITNWIGLVRCSSLSDCGIFPSRCDRRTNSSGSSLQEQQPAPPRFAGSFANQLHCSFKKCTHCRRFFCGTMLLLDTDMIMTVHWLLDALNPREVAINWPCRSFTCTRTYKPVAKSSQISEQ